MKNIFLSLFVLSFPLIATAAIFWRTVRNELRNLGGKRE